MQARLGTIVCKFGGDRVMFVVEEAICAKIYRRTDGRRMPRDCISSWNELINQSSAEDKQTTVGCYATQLPNEKKILLNKKIK